MMAKQAEFPSWQVVLPSFDEPQFVIWAAADQGLAAKTEKRNQEFSGAQQVLRLSLLR